MDLDFSIFQSGAEHQSHRLASNMQWFSSALDYHYRKKYLFYTDVVQDRVIRASISYDDAGKLALL